MTLYYVNLPTYGLEMIFMRKKKSFNVDEIQPDLFRHLEPDEINRLLTSFFPFHTTPQFLSQWKVTNILFSRLDEKTINQILESVEKHFGREEYKRLLKFKDSKPEFYRRYLLFYGVNLLSDIVCPKTNLTNVAPPPEIPMLGRKPPPGVDEEKAAGFLTLDFGFPDMVAELGDDAGLAIEANENYLDFGCQSGRTVRMLNAAYPEANWYGCDPLDDAVGWAKSNLPGISFFVNDQVPPLDIPDNFFQGVYAISVWSHFGETAAKSWLNEMWRIVKPGGFLIYSTKGFNSTLYWMKQNPKRVTEMREVIPELFRRSFAFVQTYKGGKKQVGLEVDENAWGSTYMTPEWILKHMAGKWSIRLYRPGLYSRNQDVYLLVK